MVERLTTLLWDAGGVIYSFDQSKCDRKLASDSNKSPYEVSKMLFGGSVAEREYNSGLVEGYLLGRVDSLEFYKGVKDILGLSMTYDLFIEAWTDIFNLNDQISEVIRKLKSRGIHQGILSSTNPLHWEKMNSIFDLESLLGKRNIVCTFHPDAGRKKPSTELFDVAMKRLDVRKEEVVYIDDVKKYVESGLDYGIGAGVHVDLKDPKFQEKCISDLADLGFTV